MLIKLDLITCALMEHAGKKKKGNEEQVEEHEEREGVLVSSDVAKGMHTHTHTPWRTR